MIQQAYTPSCLHLELHALIILTHTSLSICKLLNAVFSIWIAVQLLSYCM